MVENSGHESFWHNRFALFPYLLRHNIPPADIDFAVVTDAVEDVHVEKLGIEGVENLEAKHKGESHVPANFAQKRIDLVSRFVRKAEVEEDEGRSALYNLSVVVHDRFAKERIRVVPIAGNPDM